MPTDATQKVLPSPSRQFDAPERRRDTRRVITPPPPSPSNPTTQHKKRDLHVAFLVLAPSLATRGGLLPPSPPPPSILHQPNTRNATFMSRFLCRRPPLLSPPSQMRNATPLQHGVAFLVSALPPPLPLYPNTRNATPSRHGVAFLVSVLSSLPEHPKHVLWCVFWVFSALPPFSSAENGKRAQCGTFFLFWHVSTSHRT